MQGYLTGAGEDCRVDLRECFVDRRHERIHFRLRHFSNAEGLAHQPPPAAQLYQTGHYQPLKHGLDLAGWAGKERNSHTILLDPQPRSSPHEVVEDLCALDHFSLAFVDLRHRITSVGKLLPQVFQDSGVRDKRALEYSRDCLTREIVLRWAQTAAQDHEVRTLERRAKNCSEIVLQVPHYGLVVDLESGFVQFLRDEQRIGVL